MTLQVNPAILIFARLGRVNLLWCRVVLELLLELQLPLSRKLTQASCSKLKFLTHSSVDLAISLLWIWLLLKLMQLKVVKDLAKKAKTQCQSTTTTQCKTSWS